MHRQTHTWDFCTFWLNSCLLAFTQDSPRAATGRSPGRATDAATAIGAAAAAAASLQRYLPNRVHSCRCVYPIASR